MMLAAKEAVAMNQIGISGTFCYTGAQLLSAMEKL